MTIHFCSVESQSVGWPVHEMIWQKNASYNLSAAN